jgi:protein-L-isoaspartate(D-aspartate) O-methyltransferase
MQFGVMMQSDELRRNMIDCQLRTSGVNEPWVIKAMGALPRENFVASEAAVAVYTDRPVPLGNGRMLNPPVVTGLMLQAATPKKTDKILIIGAGSGYLAALVAPYVAEVVAVETDANLTENARINVPFAHIVEGPLAAGHAENAPYSLILIDGAIETLPQGLADQLAEGGRIVTGITEGPALRLASAVKHGVHLALRAFADAEIAKLPGFERAREFIF